MKLPNFAIVRQAVVYGTNERFDIRISVHARNDRGEKATAISNQHYVLRSRQRTSELIFNRLRRDVVAGIEDDQILDSPADAPIPARVYVALVAGVEPSVVQNCLSAPAGANNPGKYSARAR